MWFGVSTPSNPDKVPTRAVVTLPTIISHFGSYLGTDCEYVDVHSSNKKGIHIHDDSFSCRRTYTGCPRLDMDTRMTSCRCIAFPHGIFSSCTEAARGPSTLIKKSLLILLLEWALRQTLLVQAFNKTMKSFPIVAEDQGGW